MNPLIQGKSGTTPVMSRNAFSTNQRTNEDDSQSDPHPEAGIFGNQTMRNSGQKDRRDNTEWNDFMRDHIKKMVEEFGAYYLRNSFCGSEVSLFETKIFFVNQFWFDYE